MAKVYITWLADVLRAAGCAVREEGDWQNRDSPGDFQPIGVLWHHTAGAVATADSPAPSLVAVRDTGVGDNPPPLCHALIDWNGVFRVISAGNANHAGTSRGSGPIPAGDGSVTLVGWEIEYSAQNGQRMNAAQYSAAVKGTAAVIRRLGTDASYVRGHKETSTQQKIDPQGIEMDAVRADVAALLAGSQPDSSGGEEAGVQLLKANGVWYAVDLGAKTFWAVTSSTRLNYLIQTVGVRVMGDDYTTDVLTGFRRL